MMSELEKIAAKLPSKAGLAAAAVTGAAAWEAARRANSDRKTGRALRLSGELNRQ